MKRHSERGDEIYTQIDVEGDPIHLYAVFSAGTKAPASFAADLHIVGGGLTAIVPTCNVGVIDSVIDFLQDVKADLINRKDMLDQPLSSLGLCTRTFNQLAGAGLVSIRGLVILSGNEVTEIVRHSRTSMREIHAKLRSHGLSLGMVVTQPPDIASQTAHNLHFPSGRVQKSP